MTEFIIVMTALIFLICLILFLIGMKRKFCGSTQAIIVVTGVLALIIGSLFNVLGFESRIYQYIDLSGNQGLSSECVNIGNSCKINGKMEKIEKFKSTSSVRYQYELITDKNKKGISSECNLETMTCTDIWDNDKNIKVESISKIDLHDKK